MDSSAIETTAANVETGDVENVTPVDALDAHVLSAFTKWAGSNVTQFIHNYFIMRQDYKHIFRNRQPNSRSHTIYSSTLVVPFTKPTNNETIVFGMWQLDDDPAKFDAYHQAKLLFTELDILLKDDCLEDKKFHIIFDMALFTANHLAKITRYAGHVVSTIAVSAIPVKMGAVYLINAPDWVSNYTELYPSFDFHIINNMTDLKEYISADILPCDFGGNAALRAEFAKNYAERLCQYAGWLLEMETEWDRKLLIRNTVGNQKKLAKNKKKPRIGK